VVFWFFAVAKIASAVTPAALVKKQRFRNRVKLAVAQAQTAENLGRGCAESKHVKLRCVRKMLAVIGHLAAFFPCCGAGTRFVHLPFRVESAFLGIA
jgi:hypothetical protein